MMRRFALVFALTVVAASSAAGAPPNIVVITTDDLSLSTLDDAIAQGWMPNLKAAIIDQGLTFTNSFVADAVCTPSRATFLTGQQTHNHGVLSNDHSNGRRRDDLRRLINARNLARGRGVPDRVRGEAT